MGEGRWWGDEMRCGAFCKSSSLPLPFPRNGQISVSIDQYITNPFEQDAFDVHFGPRRQENLYIEKGHRKW